MPAVRKKDAFNPALWNRSHDVRAGHGEDLGGDTHQGGGEVPSNLFASGCKIAYGAVHDGLYSHPHQGFREQVSDTVRLLTGKKDNDRCPGFYRG